MMIVWEIYNIIKNGFYWLDIDEKTYYETFQFYHFDGNPLKTKWIPIDVTLQKKDVLGNKLSATIMPYLGRGYLAIADELKKAMEKWKVEGLVFEKRWTDEN